MPDQLSDCSFDRSTEDPPEEVHLGTHVIETRHQDEEEGTYWEERRFPGLSNAHHRQDLFPQSPTCSSRLLINSVCRNFVLIFRDR